MIEHNIPQDNNSVVRGSLRLKTAHLSHIGLGKIAYVRALINNGMEVYGIFAANGDPLATMDNRDSAIAATVQNDLVPVSVH